MGILQENGSPAKSSKLTKIYSLWVKFSLLVGSFTNRVSHQGVMPADTARQWQAVADKRISAQSLGWWQIVTAGKGVWDRILWFALGVNRVRKRSERDHQQSALALKTLRRRSTLWCSCIKLRSKSFHSCIVMCPAEKPSVLKGRASAAGKRHQVI